MNWFAPRSLYALGAAACAGLMAYALYLQYGQGLEPCPLCMAQRIAMVLMGIVMGVAAAHNPQGWGRRVYALLTMFFAGAGAALATRQLWLQSLPEDQIPACLPSLNYMFDNFPLGEVIKIMLQGSGDCAKVDWTFLHLSIAGWTLIWFSGFVLFGLFQLLRPVSAPTQRV